MTNLQIRDALAEGRTVAVRLHGNSMTPKICSGNLVTIEPLPADGQIKKGDIVFCKVRGSFYLHLVTATRNLPGARRVPLVGSVQISNNHGHVNGWTKRENVYGRLVKVEA